MIDDKPRRRQEDGGVLPQWVKLAVATIGGTILVIGWVELRYTPRSEYEGHVRQQAIDQANLKSTQESYAVAERGTAGALTDLTVDVAEIKNDVSWLRAYLDVSQPPPKKVRNGTGTHR